ncbi:hypothetical protein Cme02nite_38720 [Catellatospora methionotrophica]|uniref:Uncharacterized protein n=1 Tax=Catellatospora methionotrophica TaxID=121620 RepID=A0A8J3LMT9_9ACTN|nr:hypothetical protein [Catellatospora methionotrophica]GIG15540.1 hypothetical protein Cme02nite_38720 [Catellatospora methionotrophica]
MSTVAPLEPGSPVAERFLNTLADIQLAINARKRAAAMQQDRPAPLARQPRRKAA